MCSIIRKYCACLPACLRTRQPGGEEGPLLQAPVGNFYNVSETKSAEGSTVSGPPMKTKSSPPPCMPHPIPEMPVSQRQANDPHHTLKFIGYIEKGGFSSVYLVRDSRDGALRALKVMKKKTIKEKNWCEQVIRESQILQELQGYNHPFILTLIMTFQNQNELFMLTEYVAGGDLFYQLPPRSINCGLIDPVHVHFYMACLIDVLHTLHAHHIMHRDIKLGNIVLDKDGSPKLIDFGFAKRCTVTARTHTYCGTAPYMAPEILMREPYNQSVDMWALGALLYDLLTGKPPFGGDPSWVRRPPITLSFPDHLNPKKSAAGNLIKQLLVYPWKYRLTATQVIKSKYFENIDFELLRLRRYKYMPRQKSPPIKATEEREVPIGSVVEDDAFVGF